MSVGNDFTMIFLSLILAFVSAGCDESGAGAVKKHEELYKGGGYYRGRFNDLLLKSELQPVDSWINTTSSARKSPFWVVEYETFSVEVFNDDDGFIVKAGEAEFNDVPYDGEIYVFASGRVECRERSTLTY